MQNPENYRSAKIAYLKHLHAYCSDYVHLHLNTNNLYPGHEAPTSFHITGTFYTVNLHGFYLLN